jgi:hypothetical protein
MIPGGFHKAEAWGICEEFRYNMRVVTCIEFPAFATPLCMEDPLRAMRARPQGIFPEYLHDSQQHDDQMFKVRI